MGLANDINNYFKDKDSFTLREAYEAIKDKPNTTIRGRIYDNLGIKFERVSKGVYRTLDNSCVLIEGDGRDLSFLEDNSIDCIITDHPWEDKKSNIGGDRKFTDSYDCFKYSQKDFDEKARVLKPGSFLVEVFPAENENNYEYLFNCKKMAEKAGLLYYSKVPWKKGSFISNTGRKSKNTEDIMIFSKGKTRSLRPDVKKTKASNIASFMSGTSKMLPTEFDIEPVKRNNKIHQSEKPKELWIEILDYITLPGEIALDQFAGSGSLGAACIQSKRKCILIEKLRENIDKIRHRLELSNVF